MLRNWSEVIPAGSPDAGALVSGTEFVGLLGSEILAATASGDHGSGLFVPWTPDAGKRYKAVVTALTGGPLRLAEDGSGEADDEFTATLSVYEDNLLIADGIAINGVIGTAVSVTVAGAMSHAVTVDASATAVPPAVSITAAVQMLHAATAAVAVHVTDRLPPDPDGRPLWVAGGHIAVVEASVVVRGTAERGML